MGRDDTREDMISQCIASVYELVISVSQYCSYCLIKTQFLCKIEKDQIHMDASYPRAKRLGVRMGICALNEALTTEEKTLRSSLRNP